MAKNNKNKKAEISFLGMHVSNLIISVICIIILLAVGYKIYDMFSEKTDLQKAESNLKLIMERVQMIKDSAGLNSAEILVYLPNKWVLRSYSDSFPQAECYSKQSCLCICQSPTCANNVPKVCYGLDYAAEIPGTYIDKGWTSSDEYPNTIIFEKAAEGLKISKLNEKVLIEKMQTTSK